MVRQRTRGDMIIKERKKNYESVDVSLPGLATNNVGLGTRPNVRFFGGVTGGEAGIKMGLLELRSTDARFSNACIRAATPVLTVLFGGGCGGRGPLVDEDGLRSASGFQGGRVWSLSCSGDSITGISNERDRTVCEGSSSSSDLLAAVSLVSILCTTSHFPPSLSSASLFAVFKELRLRPCAAAPGPYTPCCAPSLRFATRPLPFSKFGVGASSIAPRRGGGGFGSRKSRASWVP